MLSSLDPSDPVILVVFAVVVDVELNAVHCVMGVLKDDNVVESYPYSLMLLPGSERIKITFVLWEIFYCLERKGSHYNWRHLNVCVALPALFLLTFLTTRTAFAVVLEGHSWRQRHCREVVARLEGHYQSHLKGLCSIKLINEIFIG